MAGEPAGHPPALPLLDIAIVAVYNNVSGTLKLFFGGGGGLLVGMGLD